MPAPPEIVRLVETFRSNEPGYIDPRYVELQTRINFIDPFFRELGWDVSNVKGLSPDQAEVFFEDTIRREAGAAQSMDPMAGKRPDYSFRMDGKRKFYVEAKKPAEDLEHNVAHAYQVRAYGWSSKLPVSVLTDFQQLAVYDCRVKPERADPASVARLDNFYITYDQYADRWDDIARLLSREAVMAGSLDKFAESKPPRGALTVDVAFLKDISEWRRLLASDIAHRNPRMSQYELNYAVQMTINRIIFLRICEDRGIERPEALKAALVESKVGSDASRVVAQGYAYRELVRQFQRADGLYNSGLFHFSDERGRHEHADTFTLDMQVGDDVLARIIEHLYYPYPYKFDVIPIEILGQVYEQFLGEVIVLGAGGQGLGASEDGATASLDSQHSALSPQSLSLPARTVTVEQKPEVRKAGGVYYTPTYIVDYIVAHTVGRLLEGKTVEEAGRLRIVDPACGSGSFLIGAYSYLLDWHLRYYMANDPETLSKKRKDRPVERVMVTAMGEHGPVEETTYRLTRAERKRILLDNIYGVDIDTQAVEVTKLSLLLKVLEGEAAQSGQIGLAVDERRILPDLGSNIKCGNSLIGPDFYASGQATFLDEQEERRINVFDWQDAFPEIMRGGGFDAVIGNPPYIFARDKGFTDTEKEYFQRFRHQAYQIHTFTMFTEHGYDLLRANGWLGYIIPNNWLTIGTMKPFRDFIAGATSSVTIVNNLYKVFSGANVDTSILLLQKGTPNQIALATSTGPGEVSLHATVTAEEILNSPLIQYRLLADKSIQRLILKIEEISIELQRAAMVKAGLKAYETGKGTPLQTDEMKKGRVYHSRQKLDPSYRMYLDGKDVKRYSIMWSGLYLKYGSNIAAPRDASLFEGDRLLVRQIPSRPPYSLNATLVQND